MGWDFGSVCDLAPPDFLGAFSEGELRDLALTAGALLNAPTAFVALKTEGPGWSIGTFGFESGVVSPEMASRAFEFARSGPCVGGHAYQDPLFAPLGAGFFAGAPIKVGGEAVGVLWGLAPDHRPISGGSLAALGALARQSGALAASRVRSERSSQGERGAGADGAAAVAASRFEGLFASLPLACYTFDASQKIQEWNVAAEDLWGIPSHVAFERTVSSTVGFAGRPGESSELARRVLKGETVFGEERPVARLDGSERWMQSNGFPLRDRDGGIVGGMVAEVDVTERHRAEDALREAKQFAESIAENSTSLLYLMDWKTKSPVWTNREVGALLGYDAEAISAMGSMTLAIVAHPEDLPAFAGYLNDFGDAEDHEVRDIETRVRHADGDWRWLWHRNRVYRRGEDGAPSVLMGTAQDVTEHKRMEESIRANEEKLRTIVESLHEGLVVEEVGKGIVLHNRSAERILGLTGDQLASRVPRDPRWRTVHEDGSAFPGSEQPITRALETGKEQPTTLVGVEWPDGAVRWVRVNAVPVIARAGESPTASIASFLDVTEQVEQERFIKAQMAQIHEDSSTLERQKAELEAANARLEAMATTDGLTGLKNHRFFQEFLREQLEVSRRDGGALSIALLDVDHFKGYNDAFGHPAGDAVLRGVAEVLEHCIRASDLVARYGGEEFVIVMPGLGTQAALAMADQVRERLAEVPFPSRRVTASFGVATHGLGLEDAASLVKAADEALYRSKSEGRNRVTHYGILCHAARSDNRRRRQGAS